MVELSLKKYMEWNSEKKVNSKTVGRGAWRAAVQGVAKSWTWLSAHTMPTELTKLKFDSMKSIDKN